MKLPTVSFVIANYNGQAYLEEAVRSALRQVGVTVEVIVVDDQSSDDSVALVHQLQQGEDRLHLLQTPRNLGPGGARNLGLRQARGEWIAVLDSDDFVHPLRSQRLMAEAERCSADLVADNLMVFAQDNPKGARLFLDAARDRGPTWIDLEHYLRHTRMRSRTPNLGFLKPMFRRAFLAEYGLCYDERLRIAEDDRFVIACLAAGGRYRLVPQPFYFYRKHQQSISHRLRPEHARAMELVSAELLAGSGAWSARARRALRLRHRDLRRSSAHAAMVEAIKRRQAGDFGRAFRHAPGGFLLFHEAVTARLGRVFRRRAKDAAAAGSSARPRAVILSRQRLAGGTSGNSAYFLAIARCLADLGYAVDLIQPSPVLFGRMPFFRESLPDHSFHRADVRQGFRAGGYLVTWAPMIWARATRGIASQLLARVGLGRVLPERKAPYSVAAPWTDADCLFVARHALPSPALVVADYAFLAEGVPYLLAPGAPSAILMHDLFHSRADQFAGGADSVAAPTAAEEFAMLDQADAVIAIQGHEAQAIRAALPGKRVILAPMPAARVSASAPGEDHRYLFVGTDTAPNVLGLGWFLDAAWPAIRAAAPDARLQVAGTVQRAFAGRAFPGVAFLGVVAELAPLYAEAGVVIAPLLQGSGLKIKLVEALSQGKACVVTPATLQGVEELAEGAVANRADATDFAEACLELGGDVARREALGKAALSCVARAFDPVSSLAEFRAWADQARSAFGNEHR